MPPLLANFIHPGVCKPICVKSLTLPHYLNGWQIIDIEHSHLLSFGFGRQKATPAISGLRGFSALRLFRIG